MPKKKESIFEKTGKPEKGEEIEESPEQFLDESEEHDAEVEVRMSAGDAAVDVYSEEGREGLIEDDEIAEWEEGFSRGEDEPEVAHCAGCGKVLSQDESKLIEREIDHTTYLFCSTACVDKGLKHAKKR